MNPSPPPFNPAQLPGNPATLSPAVLRVLEETSQHASASTQASLDLLRNNQTRVIVTGQQLGLFLGPSFTFYKIQSLLSLCDALQQKHGVGFVPIFWLQGDDHDFEEVRKFHYPASLQQQSPSTIEVPAAFAAPKVSVGRLGSYPDLGRLLTEFSQTIHCTPDILHSFQKLPLGEGSWKQVFIQMLQLAFADTGLLIFDPLHPLAKAESRSIFEFALQERQNIDRVLLDRSHELKLQGIEEQVALRKNSPLFFLHQDNASGPRFRLEEKANRFHAIGGDFSLSLDDLKQIIADSPDRISPSALLRPLLQDSLLQTSVSIGGDAELRYFQQLCPLYPLFNIPQPAAVRRMSATVFEPKALRYLKDIQTSAEAFLSHPGLLDEQLRRGGPSPEAIATEAKARVSELLGALEEEFKSFQNEMAPVLGRAEDKIHRALSGIVSRYQRVLLEATDVRSRKVQVLKQLLVPLGQAQERVFGGLYYFLRYGQLYRQEVASAGQRWAEAIVNSPSGSGNEEIIRLS